MNLLRRAWEDWKAHRRGEKRVAPRQLTGRVYARQGGGATNATSKPKGTISAKVYRANSGAWEDLGVISKEDRELM